jgi:hypothetical protein
VQIVVYPGEVVTARRLGTSLSNGFVYRSFDLCNIPGKALQTLCMSGDRPHPDELQPRGPHVCGSEVDFAKNATQNYKTFFERQ